MRITLSGTVFHATGNDLEDLRRIPVRTWNPELSVWEAPLTRKNADYLWAWRDHTTKDALAEMKALREGRVAKGTLPPGYAYKTEPFPHQEDSLLRGLDKPAYAYLLEPGLGKTHVCINDMQIAFLRGETLAALVIAPNSILSNWEEEFGKHGSFPLDIQTYDPAKKASIRRWIQAPAVPGVVKVLIMAVETFSSGEGRDFGEAFAKAQPTAIYLDESSRIKTPTSARTKALLKLAPLCVRRRIATGTCMTKGVQDAWAQFQFLGPKILNQNYYVFRNRFCVMGGYKAKQIVANRDVDTFLDMIAPYSVVYRKEECLRLPERIFQVRKIAPSEEQVKLYETLRRDGYAEVGEGAVSFTNPLVRDLRLQQIAGGFVAVEEDLARVSQDMSLSMNITMDVAEALIDRVKTVPIPGPNPKLAELLAILDEMPYKAIIWFRFKPELRVVAEKLREIYGPRSVVEFHGDIDKDGRTEARQRLQEDPTCRFFLGQIATGGLGITLTAARLSIYYSNDWSLENRLQSLDRNYRIGCNDSPIYIDLISTLPHWVDAKVYRSLSEGRDYVADLTEKMLTPTP